MCLKRNAKHTLKFILKSSKYSFKPYRKFSDYPLSVRISFRCYKVDQKTQQIKLNWQFR